DLRRHIAGADLDGAIALRFPSGGKLRHLDAVVVRPDFARSHRQGDFQLDTECQVMDAEGGGHGRLRGLVLDVIIASITSYILMDQLVKSMTNSDILGLFCPQCDSLPGKEIGDFLPSKTATLLECF